MIPCKKSNVQNHKNIQGGEKIIDIKAGDLVKVNKKIREFYQGLKEMEGRVGIVKKVIHNYSQVKYAGKVEPHREVIPSDCLDTITEKEYIRIGTRDAL